MKSSIVFFALISIHMLRMALVGGGISVTTCVRYLVSPMGRIDQAKGVN